MANIKVAVRVRPISARELNVTGSELVVRTDLNEISLTNLKVSSSKAGDSRERTRKYGFDYCFDSSDSAAENYADQSKIYETLGQSVLDAVFSGYNSCLVAYGQSASGKTYTMMGSKDDPGLTPRLCEGLFSRIESERKHERFFRVSVSYLEIYNERVRDLLKPTSNLSGLRVREHPRLGPYVQGLTHHEVCNLGSLMSYVEEGTKARKTAPTLQNPSSSRSHALLTVTVLPETSSVITGTGNPRSTTTSTSRRGGSSTRGGSKLHLVDLAGSESAATCSGVHRLKEGANINKSLVALGNVISALAERGSTGSAPGRRFIPYRDSSLTWLLKDALGGNATTIMLATISPASGSYNETAHTLRFAQRAQSVVNRPVVNEDPVARIIRELRAEVARLKSLLLEKDTQPENYNYCSCKKNLLSERLDDQEEDQEQESRLLLVDSKQESIDQRRNVEPEEERNKVLLRRFNSIENLAVHQLGRAGPVKRFGSCETLDSKDHFIVNYNRAKVTELNDEEDEISEIHESVFVDIPTLVAVLIKPDDNLQEGSTQIEEICSDEVAEDSLDAEFIEANQDHEIFDETEKPESIDHDDRSSSVNSCHASVDTELGDYQNAPEVSDIKHKSKFIKQDSIDVLTSSLSSNLHTSKRFGSVETIQRKKEPFFALERSHTNLEKRPIIQDKSKKLNNIREIDDPKIANKAGSNWRGLSGSKDHLQRKGSNDSDKSLKDSSNQLATKSKNYARKTSFENLKRKTSKDSSSSSSKDEQILISSLSRDKLLRRKGSLEQEPATVRAHTPIQRAKRSEIVAAVTERLYSSRKHTEDNVPTVSGIRSPPEGTDVKAGSSVFATKSKLQELSRKMLAKRRRVCADTQTDIQRTVRVKDAASLTEEPRVVCQDIGVLTDDHVDCGARTDNRTPVLRVKEIATLTDKHKTNIVRCKDVGSLATDFEDYDYEIHSPRNDSGILSDDTQNYAESNLSSTEVSDVCDRSDKRIVYADNSTNTMFSSCRSSSVQTPMQDIVSQDIKDTKVIQCPRQCCNSLQETCPVKSPVKTTISSPVLNPIMNPVLGNSEKNVITISLPDTISITIESTNVLESRIAVSDGSDSSEEKSKLSVKNGEVQTEMFHDFNNQSRFSFKDFTRSTLSQTDGRVFRIENIFQDPNNVSRTTSKADIISDTENGRIKNSVIFTNSLGTSYAPDIKDCVKDPDEERTRCEDLSCGLQRSHFIRDGLITEAFIKKRSFSLSPRKRSHSIVYNNPWNNWMMSYPTTSMDSIDYRKGVHIEPSIWGHRNGEMLINNSNFSCVNCSGIIPMESNQQFLRSHEAQSVINIERNIDNPSSSSNRLEPNNSTEHDHNFSDDSLDYNENNMASEKVILHVKNNDECETRESLCPPDVVAHTKKEVTKSPNNETGNLGESLVDDFEDSHVELPKKTPSELVDNSLIHDYTSLILGKPCKLQDNAREEESDSTKSSSRANSNGKKKVSFSNTNIPEIEDQETDPGNSSPNQKPTSFPKSIIKKKKKVDTTDSLDVLQSSNDETDDSLQEDKSSLTSETSQDISGLSGTKSISNEESPGFREEANSEDEKRFLSNPRSANSKKVKFSRSDIFENTCSDSDSYGNLEDEDDEEEESPSEKSNRNILEEYLSEAVTFMRNMNSINEYMSATKMFDKYGGRGRRRAENRRRISTSWNQDYVEFQGRRISLEDDTDRYLQEDDDIIISTESYDRCMDGIHRLENCIRKVDKQNEVLREKFGINCESAGARLGLASPSADLAVPSLRKNDSKKPDTLDCDLSSRETMEGPRSSLQTDITNNNVKTRVDDNNDDLEKRIFDQLMSAADSAQYSTMRKLRQGRLSRFSDIKSRSPTTYSKYRGRLLYNDSESYSSDIRRSSNPEEALYDNVPYESRDESSTSRYLTTRMNLDNYLDSTEEDDPRESINYNFQYGRLRTTRDRSQDEDDRLKNVNRDGISKLNLSSQRGTYGVPRFSESDDSFENGNFRTSINFLGQRTPRNTKDRIHESDESSRRTSASRGNPVPRTEAMDMKNSTEPITGNRDSMRQIPHFKDKLKYPGSPRARFLQLLRERRRIVESSRGTGAS